MKLEFLATRLAGRQSSERRMALTKGSSPLKWIFMPMVAGLVLGLPIEKLKAENHVEPQTDTQIEHSIKRGLMLSENLCKRCHAIGLTDQAPRPDIPPFRKLAEKGPIDNLAEAFAEGIVTGHNDMPEFQFDTDEINDLLNYIESVQVK